MKQHIFLLIALTIVAAFPTFAEASERRLTSADAYCVVALMSEDEANALFHAAANGNDQLTGVLAIAMTVGASEQCGFDGVTIGHLINNERYFTYLGNALGKRLYGEQRIDM